MEERFDYIVVGAGSAGCAVARGLSDNPAISVLLIEAGPHANAFWVRTPAGMARLYHDARRNWNFQTEPMKQLEQRSMYWPRGKTLGGSSAINGMVFIRGHPLDFEDWALRGNAGWGWSDVLPHFKSMEHFERGEDAYRGGTGPLWISDPVVKERSSYDFIESARQTGIPFTEDMNGEVHDGVGFMQHTIRRGKRHSAWSAFIEPIASRPNLTVITDTHVRRVLFEKDEAVGVEIESKGVRRTVHAMREVVLSAGSLKSPQILMISGVGPAAELARHGIPLIRNLEGVGRNLQDHFYIHTAFRVTPNSSYNARLAGMAKYLEGARYLLTGKGYLALGSSQVAAFVKSSPDEPRADLQISFRPMSFAFQPNGSAAVESHPGVGVSVYQLRPATTGLLTLRSPDIADDPVCRPDFLTSQYDIDATISGIRKIRQIMTTGPIAARVVREDLPGAEAQDDAAIYRFMEQHGNSAHHQGGTCRMGTDALAVVDPQLRVCGLKRLRVVDASIMPSLTSGNTNAPSIMIGVKAATMIAADAVPPRQSE